VSAGSRCEIVHRRWYWNIDLIDSPWLASLHKVWWGKSVAYYLSTKLWPAFSKKFMEIDRKSMSLYPESPQVQISLELKWQIHGEGDSHVYRVIPQFLDLHFSSCWFERRPAWRSWRSVSCLSLESKLRLDARRCWSLLVVDMRQEDYRALEGTEASTSLRLLAMLCGQQMSVNTTLYFVRPLEG